MPVPTVSTSSLIAAYLCIFVDVSSVTFDLHHEDYRTVTFYKHVG